MTADPQLVELVSQMMQAQQEQHGEMKEASRLMMADLGKLRDNIHEIKNDYHAQSELVKHVYRDVEDIKAKQERDIEKVHCRIDSHDKKLESHIERIENDIKAIKKRTEGVQDLIKIKEHATKVIVGAVMLALIVMAGNQIAGTL